MKYRWFAKLVLSGMLSVGVTLDAQSQERVAYDKCILSNVATVKDRYALAAVKRACFNLTRQVAKVPPELWGTSIQLILEPVAQRGYEGVIIGSEGWHRVTITNDTPYRLSAIRVTIYGKGMQQTLELMNHPFTGINDIDFMHVLPYAKNNNYYVDLRNHPQDAMIKLVHVMGVRE